MTKVSLGTISHGTLRNEDLIPAFADELRSIDPVKAQSILDDFGIASGPSSGTEEFYDSQEANEMVNVLIDALDHEAPPYCYFGSLEGDGSDFGFWPSLDSLEEDARYGEDVIKVSELSEVPDDATGYVMHVNDHGNVTLYEIEIPAGNEKVDSLGRPWTAFRVAADHLTEIWSIV